MRGTIRLGALEMKVGIAKSEKRFLAKTSLLAFGAGFELVSRHVEAMQNEIEAWDDGRKVGIGVWPGELAITIEKRAKDNIAYLGFGLKEPDVTILFKNLDSAILLFMAQLGAANAVAERRVIVHGDNALAMQVTRTMAIVQSYLFPTVLLKPIFKRAPKLGSKELMNKALIYAKLIPKLAQIAGR